jgi:hypothetical protein
VVLSTTKAKYKGLTDAARDIVYLRRLFNELKIGNQHPTPILNDKQSCIKLVHNPILHARTKHIEIQYHFIRERNQTRDIIVRYIPTYEQQADILTKPFKKTNFEQLREALGIRPLPTLPNS